MAFLPCPTGVCTYRAGGYTGQHASRQAGTGLFLLPAAAGQELKLNLGPPTGLPESKACPLAPPASRPAPPLLANTVPSQAPQGIGGSGTRLSWSGGRAQAPLVAGYTSVASPGSTFLASSFRNRLSAASPCHTVVYSQGPIPKP